MHKARGKIKKRILSGPKAQREKAVTEKNLICPGFVAAAAAAGIKKADTLDLGVIAADKPVPVAGVFTRNKVKAAPVLIDQARVAKGFCRAVVANAGCANCCTGKQGMDDAIKTAAIAARALGADEKSILVASTGAIGSYLPMNKIEAALPGLCASIRPDGFADFARCIMTTDRQPKISRQTIKHEGKSAMIMGIAKGAGMIRPDMATMLCFIVTDIIASPDELGAALSASVEKTFNRISVDGDTSTNDTALIMASGESRLTLSACAKDFQKALDAVCLDLAKMMVADGEGATVLFTVNVVGAKDDAQAFAVADAVGHSPLVKTAVFGKDANWGRILAAAGRSGADVDPEKISVSFDKVQVVKKGMGLGKDAEKKASQVMKNPQFALEIDLGLGKGSSFIITCDLTYDYVKINADYRT